MRANVRYHPCLIKAPFSWTTEDQGPVSTDRPQTHSPLGLTSVKIPGSKNGQGKISLSERAELCPSHSPQPANNNPTLVVSDSENLCKYRGYFLWAQWCGACFYVAALWCCHINPWASAIRGKPLIMTLALDFEIMQLYLPPGKIDSRYIFFIWMFFYSGFDVD